MKKFTLSLLFTMLLAFSAVADNLTDTLEQSEMPVCVCETLYDGTCLVTITGPEGAEIYYLVFIDSDEAEVLLYDGPVLFTEQGNYHLVAFAIEPGKTQSEYVEMDFVVFFAPNPGEYIDPPIIESEQLEDGSYKVTMTPADPASQIFYHVNVKYGDGEVEPYEGFESLYDFKIYNDTLYFTEPGDYGIQAYAYHPGVSQNQGRSVVIGDGFTITSSLEPTEITIAPSMSLETLGDNSCLLTITPNEPGCEIYYRVGYRDEYSSEDMIFSDYYPYTDPLWFTSEGFYSVWAYAITPGKLQSEYVVQEFVIAYPMPLEMTAAPAFDGESFDLPGGTGSGYRVTIIPYEPDCDIYYRFARKESNTGGNDWEFSDYLLYTAPLDYTQNGFYRIEAYAIAPGKDRSYGICYEFTVNNPVMDYDFEVDGVFYKITSDDEVSVSYETTSYNTYSGNVVIPCQVTYDGVTYDVTAIRENAFKGCDELTGVTIGGYVTEIGTRAFMNCTALTEVVLGNYVITVGDGAFAGCSALTTLTIGSGVASIGIHAFAGCTALTTIICKPATPPTMGGVDTFSCYDTATLIVYPAVKRIYFGTAWWNQFVTIVGQDTVDPLPGDMNGDGELNLTDITSLINTLINAH